VKLTIAWIGKTKNPAVQSLTDEYLKRLKQYADVDSASLKDEAALLKLSGREAGLGAI
jgi:23S rRNA pseudoU1915 N3-methylase RlmH